MWWAPTPESGSLSGGGSHRLPIPSWSTIGKLASSLGQFLRPEILRPRTTPTQDALSSTPAAISRSRTAWLDGLRGWAALTVCWVHLSVTAHHDLELCNGFETTPGKPLTSPAMWPFVRVLFSGGQFSVAVFFTISGYVLTRRPLTLLYESRRDDFTSTIHSSLFRRPIRLLFPVASSILFFLVLFHIVHPAVPGHDLAPTLLAELWLYIQDMAQFAFVYGGEMHFSRYNLHTWTIPVELRGSLMLFVWLFVVSRLSHGARVVTSLCAAGYLLFFTWAAWYASFFAGMLLAEASLAAENRAVSPGWFSLSNLRKLSPRLYPLLTHALLLLGLWLASAPSDASLSPIATSSDENTAKAFTFCPQFNILLRLHPSAYDILPWRWFYYTIGALLLVFAAQEIPWLRRVLEWPCSQYLGRVSFTLYLVHGHLLALVSERLFWAAGVYSRVTEEEGDMAMVESRNKLGYLKDVLSEKGWWVFPAGGPYGLEPNFLACAVGSVVLFLYAAEVGTRLFDTPSVRVASWVYNRSKMVS